MAFAQKIIYLKFGHLRNLLYGCLVPSAIAQYATIAQNATGAQYAPFAVRGFLGCHTLPLVTTKGESYGMIATVRKKRTKA